MSISSAALKYVNALTDVSDLVELKSVADGLSVFGDSYKSSNELRLAVQNPAIPMADRIGLVDGFVKPVSSSNKLANLLKLLVANSRVELVHEILEALRVRIARMEKCQAVEVFSARAVSLSERAEFEMAITKKLGAACQLTWKVDESLIGGVQIKAGDIMLDRSVSGAIDRAERELFAC